MTRQILLTSTLCALASACASAPKASSQEQASGSAAHQSADGQFQLRQRLPGEVKIAPVAVGYMVTVADAEGQMTCVVGEHQKADSGAMLFNAIVATRKSWQDNPMGKESRLFKPWFAVLGGHPAYGLTLGLKAKDDSVTLVPLMVASHPLARVYCAEARGPVELLQKRAGLILSGIHWKDRQDPSLPIRDIYALSIQVKQGGIPAGFLIEGTGRDREGRVISSTQSMFAVVNGEGDFTAVDIGSSHAGLPDGTLDVEHYAEVKNGRMTGSATVQRQEDGSYKLTGASGETTVDQVIPATPKILAANFIQHWMKKAEAGKEATFAATSLDGEPWVSALKVVILKVQPDGRRLVRSEQDGQVTDISFAADGKLRGFVQPLGDGSVRIQADLVPGGGQ